MANREQDSCVQNPDQIRIEAIRALNDTFRKRPAGGQLMLTEGIIGLGGRAMMDVLLLVSEFDEFDPSNDPYREHDFGAITYRGDKIFWKIDYYDRSLQYGSENPADPSVTTRVLTVMLAREY